MQLVSRTGAPGVVRGALAFRELDYAISGGTCVDDGPATDTMMVMVTEGRANSNIKPEDVSSLNDEAALATDLPRPSVLEE